MLNRYPKLLILAFFYVLVFLYVPVFFVLISCSGKKQVSATGLMEKQFPILFSCSQPTVSNGSVICKFELRAKKTGDTILFTGFIKNGSGDTLKIHAAELQLETIKGFRTDISWCRSKNLMVLPNSNNTINFEFVPINNQKLYERINYAGDMDSIYFTKINFITGKNDRSLFEQKLQFSSDKKSYAHYKNQFGREKTLKLFNLKNESNELSVGGALIRLSFYSMDSILFLQAKIINHGKSILNLQPFKFKLKANHTILEPQTLSVDNTIYPKGNIMYNLRGGERLTFKLKYGKINSNEFIMMKTGIASLDSSKKVIKNPLKFEAGF